MAPDSHPHSGSNSGKSVEPSLRASGESNSSLTTNPSSHFTEEGIQTRFIIVVQKQIGVLD